MAKHVWSVLCYKGCLDRFTNRVSLLDVVDQVQIAEPPLLEEKKKSVQLGLGLQLVSLWIRSDFEKTEKTYSRITIAMPNGKRAAGPEQEHDLISAPRHRVFIDLSAIPYKGPGIYYFLVQEKKGKKWNTVATIPLEVSQKTTGEKVISKEEKNMDRVGERSNKD